MASGHPDWREYESGTPKGTSISVENFSKAVTSRAIGTIDITAVKELDEVYYNLLAISCPDDTGLHRVRLLRIADSAVLFDSYFITAGAFNLSSVKLLSEEQVKIEITNNSSVTLFFKGVISWSSRFTYYTADPPGGGGETCFLAGTKILMGDLNTKNIEDVKVGDIVISYDLKGKARVRKKVNMVKHYKPGVTSDFHISINNELKADPDQLIMVNKEWKEAQDIKVGDMLFAANGSDIKITSIARTPEKVPTYDLNIEDTSSYFADGVLVHNACPY